MRAIVGLPAKGIWYKDVKTVLLFADGAGPTADLLFVEVTPPAGQKNFTKKKPLTRDVLAPYIEIVRERQVGEHSWVEPIGSIEARGWDIRPLRPAPDPALTVADAAERISTVRVYIDEIAAESARIAQALEGATGEPLDDWPLVKLSEIITPNRDRVTLVDDDAYKRVRVALHGRGLFLRDQVKGPRSRPRPNTWFGPSSCWSPKSMPKSEAWTLSRSFSTARSSPPTTSPLTLAKSDALSRGWICSAGLATLSGRSPLKARRTMPPARPYYVLGLDALLKENRNPARHHIDCRRRRTHERGCSAAGRQRSRDPPQTSGRPASLR